MTCKELTNDLLLDYADWQLPPHERNRVARHLDACEPCRVRRDELEGMTGALRHSTEAPPSALMAQLDRAVLGSLPQTRVAAPPQAPRGRLLSWRAVAAGLAAMVAIGVVAFLAGDRTGRDRALTAIRESRPAPQPPPPEPKPKAVENPVNVIPPRPPKPDPKPEPVLPDPRIEPKPEPKSVPPPAIVKEPDPPTPQPKPDPRRGDLNGDGQVDIADARILQQKITLGEPLPGIADVNGDGMVDIADVREILRAELAAR